MNKINSLEDIIVKEKSFAVTIGNFDGVHRGHQKMLKDILESCQEEGLELIVITFRPHPIQILKPKENFLINSYDERVELFESLGIPYLFEISFTRDFSTLGPEDFLKKFVAINGVEKIFLGYDFVFGANKAGNAEFVESFCQRRNIKFELMNEFTGEDQKYSSTQVRKLLNSGDVVSARELLGRNFYVSGRVVKGAGRGKTIGFPTANISYDESRIIPKRGVYVTKTHYKDQVYHSVTNIGLNPTFDERECLSVESHLLDFDSDIYGDRLKVEFLERLRDETKFSSVNELVEQINRDVEIAKKVFRAC